VWTFTPEIFRLNMEAVRTWCFTYYEADQRDATALAQPTSEESRITPLLSGPNGALVHRFPESIARHDNPGLGKGSPWSRNFDSLARRGTEIHRFHVTRAPLSSGFVKRLMPCGARLRGYVEQPVGGDLKVGSMMKSPSVRVSIAEKASSPRAASPHIALYHASTKLDLPLMPVPGTGLSEPV